MKSKLIYIEWVDSNVQHGWAEDEGIPPSLAMCQTAGLFDCETAEYISVVLSRSDLGSHMERLIIPKGCIRKVKRVEV